MSIGMRVNERDLARINGKLDDLLDAPLRRFFARAAIFVQGKARERAPVDTGRLRASLTYEIDDAHPPLWARVGTDVTQRGVSYPRVLEESDITHYRGTQRQGQATKGWLTQALHKDSLAKIKSYLADVRADIRARWDRR